MEKRNVLVFSIAIILAAITIATGVLIHRTVNTNNLTPELIETPEIKIRPVTEDDHLLGNPNADIILIEYADLDCPYCHEFHSTMERIMNDYGKTGQIAWVYRQFPLESLSDGIENIKENKPAIASECVASLGGNIAFWDFIHTTMLEAPSPVSDEFLLQTAMSLGIDESEYNICILSGRFNTRIERDINDGLAIYEFDPDFVTPYNIIVTKTGIQTEISGSQPYSTIKEMIENLSFPVKLEVE